MSPTSSWGLEPASLPQHHTDPPPPLGRSAPWPTPPAVPIIPTSTNEPVISNWIIRSSRGVSITPQGECGSVAQYSALTRPKTGCHLEALADPVAARGIVGYGISPRFHGCYLLAAASISVPSTLKHSSETSARVCPPRAPPPRTAFFPPCA